MIWTPKWVIVMISGDEIVGYIVFHALDRIWAVFDWDENENKTFSAVCNRDQHNRHYHHLISLTRPAISNRCAAAYWCDAEGPQVRSGIWGKVGKKRESNWGIKFVEIHGSIISKNNTMIIILAIELLDVNLLLVFLMINSFLKNWWCALTISAPYSVYRELKKVEKLWTRLVSVVSTEFWYGGDTTFGSPEHSLPLLIGY
jgi:hypothetical protein